MSQPIQEIESMSEPARSEPIGWLLNPDYQVEFDPIPAQVAGKKKMAVSVPMINANNGGGTIFPITFGVPYTMASVNSPNAAA